MRFILFSMTFFLALSGRAASAAGPGEGDCSAQFIHDIKIVQHCSETGVCTVKKKSPVTFAGVLTCGDPWGQLFRVCFKTDECIDGKATERKTIEGDSLFSSILANPKSFGGLPKKIAITMSWGQSVLPNQLIVFGVDKSPFSELLFGDTGSASLIEDSQNKGEFPSKLFFRKPNSQPPTE